MKYFVALTCLFSLNLSAAIQIPNELTGVDLVTEKAAQIAVNAKDKKGTVVLFMSAKCPCSNSHIPVVKKMVSEFPQFQFVVVHSNADESKQDSQTYFKKAELNIPVIQDDQAKLADSFKAFKTPHAFVIAANGEVLYQGGVTNSANGPAADQNYLQNALAAINEGKPVAVANGRTLGCVISRKE